MLWPLYSRMCTEHGFARIIIICMFNKEWQCFQICQYLLKMADILFVTMETGGLADKHSIYFLLSKTHSILLADKITRFAEIQKLSYLPAVCGLNLILTSFLLKLSFTTSPSLSSSVLLKTEINDYLTDQHWFVVILVVRTLSGLPPSVLLFYGVVTCRPTFKNTLILLITLFRPGHRSWL